MENHKQWLEFDAIVHKACQAEVSERYQSAEAMHQELALLQRGQSVKESRAARRRRGMVRNLCLVIAVLAVLGTLFRIWKAAQHGYIPNPGALRLYKLGQWHYSQLTPEAHAKALQVLKQATEADPKFVQPYGEWLMLYTWNMVPDSSTEQRRLEHVRDIANKALAIDPNAAEGHAALSWCKFLQRDWRGAEEEIQHAIRLNPNLPTAHDIYCFYLSMQGRIDEAHREGRIAEALEPPGSERVTAVVASWPYVAARRIDLAIPQLRRALDLDRNFAWGHAFLARCYESQSNYLAAIEEYRTSALLVSNDRARIEASYDALRQALAEQGDAGYLRKWIELIRADQDLPEDQKLFRNDIVGYYARLGQKDKAFDELEKHFDEPQVWHQIKFIATYDSLHDEQRFKELVKRARLQP